MTSNDWRTVHGRELACGSDAWNLDAPAWRLRDEPGVLAYRHPHGIFSGLYADLELLMVDGRVIDRRMCF